MQERNGVINPLMRHPQWLGRAASVLLAGGVSMVVCAAAAWASSVAVVCGEADNAATAAFRAHLCNALLDRLAEVDVHATVVGLENALVRRALADHEIRSEDAVAPKEPAVLARLARGIGVDWLLALRIEELVVEDELAEAQVGVVGRLVNATTGGHTELQAQKRAGETEVLEGLEARQATASCILALAMANMLCEAVVGRIAEGGEDRKPSPGLPVASAQDVAEAHVDATGRLEQQIQQQGATAELCLRLGEAYLVDGQWELARKEFERAADLDPTLAAPHIRLGEMASERGLWQDAIGELKIALELEPANTSARLAISRAYERASQPAAALKELQVAARVAPDNGTLWVRLGDMQRRLEASKEAEEAYLLALQAKHSDPRANGRLGQLYAQRGRFKDAFKYYVEAAKEKDGGLPQTLNERHYRATMAAGDEALASAMRASRDALQAFHEGETTREEAYGAFARFAERSGDISRFAEAVQPPTALRKQHNLRLLTYALVEESDLTILQYVETNDASHLEYARQVRDEAVEELEKLLKGNRASR